MCRWQKLLDSVIIIIRFRGGHKLSQNVTFCPFPVDFEYDIFKVDVIEDMSFMK